MAGGQDNLVTDAGEKHPFLGPTFYAEQEEQDGYPFAEWCRQNYRHFWKQSIHAGYPAISLGERPMKVFKQILAVLKTYHDQNLGYGNLRNGITISNSNEVIFCNVKFAEFAYRDHIAMCDDILDFKDLVGDAVQLVEKEFQRHSKAPVDLPASLKCFFRLHDHFTKYTATILNIRAFSFFVRNNPLFLDTTGNYLLAQKIIDLRDGCRKYFDEAIRKDVSAYLSNWYNCVRLPQLLNVLNFDNKKHEKLYFKYNGVYFFFKSCFGHAKSYDRSLDNGKIMELIQDDLPFVLPSLFLGMVLGLDKNSGACFPLCGSSLIEFLQKMPTVFS